MATCIVKEMKSFDTYIEIIKYVRRALSEVRKQNEGFPIESLQDVEHYIYLLLQKNVKTNFISKAVDCADLLCQNGDEYIFLDFHYSEQKRNNNFFQTTRFRKLYDLINSVKEDASVLTFFIYGNLQVDAIHFYRQESKGEYNIEELISMDSIPHLTNRKSSGLYTQKISPAYYINREDESSCFINEITIKNYKFFSDEKTFYFQNRFSILIGDNSSGKTSFLDAIKASLKSLLSNMGNQRSRVEPLPQRCRYIPNKGAKSNKIEFDRTPIIRLNDVHQNIQEKSYPTQLQCYVKSKNDWTEWTHEKKEGSTRFRRIKSTQAIDYAIDLYELTQKNANEQVVLPMFAYYGIHRTYDKHSKNPQLTLTRTDGYTNCFDAQTSYSYFKEWFRTFEQNPHILECFKKTILTCLESEHVTNIEYKKDIEVDGKICKLDDFIITRTTDAGEEHVLMKNLSAGYKIVCSMVADMAYRCLQLNAPLNEADNPIERTYGLVLIDEIDMHLHPLWQRHIVRDLMQCFPKIQFIATTHSPFIVQSLHADQIINLQKNQEEEVYISKDPSTLNVNESSRLMGVKSQYGSEEAEKRSIETQLYNLLIQESPNKEKLKTLINAYKVNNNPDPYFLAHLSFDEKQKLKELGIDI